MLTTRLIPVLLYKNGILVRSRTFSLHQAIGDPITQVQRLTAWKADELIYLDISRDEVYDSRLTMNVIGSTSSSKGLSVTMQGNFCAVVKDISRQCRIPLTVGGKIRSIEDIRVRLASGADKVSINTEALRNPRFVREAAETFGSQCIVVSIDAKFDPSQNTWEVYSGFGKDRTGLDPAAWAEEAADLGAGEILIQSIDRDGTGKGYDLSLLKGVSKAVTVPVIALGGVGDFKHLAEGIKDGQASAVAAANIFHFTELSVIHAKKHMKQEGICVRL